MVFNYTIRGGPCLNANSHITLASSDIVCYVGRDKHENEYLIKYGWPGDMWFHVDSLSSAHVYFRICTEVGGIPLEGIPIDDLPSNSVYDMMQLVKHNSISGCKLASTKIVYTPHSNLKKLFEMDSGTVTYHDTKLCRYARCDKDRPRVKELEQTKTERMNVNFYEEMKANERRIIQRKKRERNSREQQDNFGLYDPLQDEEQTARRRATRSGDDESGVDQGLAALEELSFASITPAALAPPQTAAGGVTKEGSGSGTTTTTTNKDDARPPDEPIWVKDANDRSIEPSAHVRFLRARGYTALDAVGALRVLLEEEEPSSSSSKNPETAALKQLWHNCGGAIRSTPSSHSEKLAASSEKEAAREGRKEEKEVLQAIFGQDEGVHFSSDDEELFDSIFPITPYEPPPRYESPPPLLLEIYVDHHIAPLYPLHEPPVLALVGGGLPERLLKELTIRLRTEVLERCQEEPGDPQIFNLLGFLSEAVETIIEEETAELDAQRKQRYEERKKAEAERKKEEQLNQPTAPSSKSVLYRNEAERRAYARNMLAGGGDGSNSKRDASTTKAIVSTTDTDAADESKKKPGGKTYDTGTRDQDLIDDFFNW